VIDPKLVVETIKKVEKDVKDMHNLAQNISIALEQEDKNYLAEKVQEVKSKTIRAFGGVDAKGRALSEETSNLISYLLEGQSKKLACSQKARMF